MKTNPPLQLIAAVNLSLILLLSGCSSDEKNVTSPSIQPASWFTDVAGVWEQQGYGNIMQIGETDYTIYQISQVACIKQGTWSIDSLEDELANNQKNNTLNQIELQYHNNDTLQRFVRIDALPVQCENGGSQASNDPELNFDVLWHTFNKHYAFFTERLVDWDEAYGQYRQQVNATTTAEELFTIFREMLASLQDGHISVTSDQQSFSGGTMPMILQRVYNEFANQTEVASLEDYIEQQVTAIDSIIVNYLNGQVEQGANNRLAWGKLSPSVGYLMVREMTNFVDNANAQTSDLENLHALQPVIEKAMEQLANTNAMVIDMRLNGGGQAKSALEIASYFFSQTTPVFSVKAKLIDGFTESQTFDLMPASHANYYGQVVVLTSGITASASEIFLLSLLERGQVTLVGETTEGIFSNQLQRQLPNGWHFTLSNEVYQSIDGKSYEVGGITPSIQQVVFPFADRARGIDSGLDKALEVLAASGVY